MMNKFKVFALLFFLCLSFINCQKANLNKKKYKGIERTLSILNSSSAENPQTLDILFYGQSIIGGMKTDILIDSLSKRFPNTKITFKHKPIGGFTIPSLIKTAEHDVYQENPDLIIFHAYDGIKDGLYDKLIKTIRERMSSDIMLLNHHYVWDKPEERLERVNISHDNDSKEIENIANKYDCALVDVRNHWAKHLETENIGVNELMGNKVDPNVHPNAEGSALLRNIVLDKLFLKNETNYRVEQDSLRNIIPLETTEGFITENFIGNRVDLFTSNSTDEAKVEVLIDGKKPSEIKGSYYITRPSKGYYGWMPAVKNVSFGSTFPREESWSVSLFDINREAKTFKYKVEGSLTGFDGEGNSESDFLSNSKRIKIEKDDFYIFTIERISKKETPENFKINFEVKQIGKDILVVKGEDTKHTIFRGSESKKQTLTLRLIEGDLNFKKLIIYKPFIDQKSK